MRDFKIASGSKQKVCWAIVENLRPHIPAEIADQTSFNFWKERLDLLNDRVHDKLFRFSADLSVYMVRYRDDSFTIKVIMPVSPS